MAKQDVLEAIDATIIPNGIKGITADTLNSVLTMIVENAGEGGGSGDGALRIMVPDTMIGIHEEFIAAGEFSPAIWEQIKVEVANSPMPVDIAAWDATFSACFAHNAEVYQSIITKVESHEGTFAILDQSLSMAATYKMMIDLEVPGAVEKVDVSLGQLALCVGMRMHPAEGYEEMFGPQADPMIMVTPLYGQPDMEMYPPELMMILMPDGSIMFDASSVGGYQFYIPESSNVILTSDQKSANRSFKSYGTYSDFSWDNVTVFFVRASSSIPDEYNRVNFVSYDRNDGDNPYFCYFQGTALMKATLTSDGSVSVDTLGVLTAPTE